MNILQIPKKLKQQLSLNPILMNAIHSLHLYIYILEVKNDQIIYSFANQPGLKILNVEEDIIGKSLDEVLSKERVEFLTNYYSQAIKTRQVITFEEEIILPDGQKILTETDLTPFFDKEETYIIAVVDDITAKREQLNEIIHSKTLLSENEQRLSALVDNNDDAVLMFDERGTFLEINQAAERITGYSVPHLIGTNLSKILPEQEQEKIQLLFQLGSKGETKTIETSIYHRDGYEVPISIKTVPVIIEDTVKGLFAVIKDISAEQEMIKELQQVKARFESFMIDSLDPILIMNQDRKIEFFNEAFINTYGYSKDELMGKEIPIVPDWMKNKTDELYQKVLQGENIQGTHVKRQRKSGELLDISLTLSPIYSNGGEVIGVSSITRDITEHKQKTLKIIKEKSELELVWNYAPHAICLIGTDGNIVKVNKKFEKTFGWGTEEILQKPFASIQPSSLYDQVDSLLEALRQSNDVIESETQQVTKNGNILEVKVSYQPVHQDNILAIITYEDITETNKELRMLIESNARYENIIECMPEAIAIHNDGEITYANKKALELVGADNSNQVIGKTILDFTHEDYLEEEKERVKMANRNGKKSELINKKLKTLDGKVLYIDAFHMPIDLSTQSSVLVMVRDITARKKVEKAVKESEQRFRIIAEESSDVVDVVKPNGFITYSSPSVEETLGYPVRDVIGQKFKNYIHSEDTDTFQKSFDSVFITKEIRECEVRKIHLEGYAVWMHLKIIPIENPQGDVEQTIIISWDISENKRKEEKLSKMAFYDHLTGLPNRRLFEDRLQQAMYTTNRTGKLTALMMLDCDKFKEINDTLGHDVGDEVIKEFANRVKASLRKSDTLSRVGGDEFTIVLPELRNENELDLVANRILDSVRKPIQVKDHKIEITTSIGVAFYPKDGPDVNALYKQADVNLYKIKELGGNAISC